MHMCMQLAESFLARYQGTREFSGVVLTMSNRQQVSSEISWSGLADGGGSDIAAQVATFVQFQRDGIGGHSWICSVWSSRWERLKEPKLHSWNSLDACWLTHGVRKQDKSHWPFSDPSSSFPFIPSFCLSPSPCYCHSTPFPGTRDNHLRAYKHYRDSFQIPKGFMWYRSSDRDMFESVSGILSWSEKYKPSRGCLRVVRQQMQVSAGLM